MLAVDLSASMEEQDFIINKKPVDRLTAIKWVASDLLTGVSATGWDNIIRYSGLFANTINV